MEDALTKTLAIGRPISYSLPTNEYRKRQLAIKQSLIDEAVSWPGDTEEGKFIFTEVWSGYGYSVKFGKYGKEYYRINRRNVNDMMPAVFKDGNRMTFDASFRAIFRLVEEQYRCHNYDTIITLACIFVREAFLVDHKPVGDKYRYAPPCDAVGYLQETIGKHKDVPIEVFLHYIDAIAWQEDVKYNTLGKSVTSDIGMTNNMLTYAHFCACLLGRASWAEMLNKYSMGVSPLRKADIASVFPELDITY